MQIQLKKVLAFLLVCLPGFVVAQQNVQFKKDSLLAKISKTHADTIKIKLFNELSDLLVNTNNAESKGYAQKGLILSEKIKWDRGMVNSYIKLAQAAYAAKDYNPGLDYINLALPIAERTHNTLFIGFCYAALAELYRAQGNTQQALNAYVQTAKYLPEKGQYKMLVYVLTQLGGYYTGANNYEKAIDYYLRAKKLAERGNDASTKASSNYSLGGMYYHLQEYKKALPYYLEAWKYFGTRSQKSFVFTMLTQIGVVYDDLKDFNNALLYFDKALIVAREQNLPANIALANANVAWTSYEKGDYARAYPLVKESLDLTGNEQSKLGAYNTMGCILRDAPDTLLQRYGIKPGEKYQQAIHYFLLADKSTVITLKRDNYRDMSLTYERMNKPLEAYEAYKHYIALRDSSSVVDYQRLASQKELQFDANKRADSLKYAQNLTNEKLKQQSLLATQRRQALTLANKEKDIERLNYLRSQVSLQAEQNGRKANMQQLKASQKEQALAQTTVKLQEAEITSKRYQGYYFLAGLSALLLLAAFIGFNYYNQRKSNRLLSAANQQITNANNALEEQREEITTQRDRLAGTIKELKATQNQLIQSEKMASLGELTAGIAHEIQNPLNFVNNFSEVSAELTAELKEALKSGDTADAMELADSLELNLGKITHHGKRADFIVKGMLQHSRKSTGEKLPTNINILADEFLKLSYQGLRAKNKDFNADMSTDFDKDLPRVNVAQQDIGRVLLNLYNNAFYAVQQKQKTAGPDYKPHVVVGTDVKDGMVEISVIDNGVGIPDAIKEKILQPFFTTKPTGEGTGLGLSISYDIVVKAHGGKIDVVSAEGEYTRFSILLPLA